MRGRATQYLSPGLDPTLALAKHIMITLYLELIDHGRSLERQVQASRQPDATGLSPRRQEVLEWLLDGHPEVLIADRLGISPDTVHGHVQQIYRHFSVHSRVELMALWIRGVHPVETPLNQESTLDVSEGFNPLTGEFGL